MSELPMVERAKYTAWDRLRDLILALLCFAAPVIYDFFYPDHFTFLQEHLAKGELRVFDPLLALPGEPEFFRPFRLLFAVCLMPIVGILYLVGLLFKADETWTITESTLTLDQRHLIGRGRKVWSIGQISRVRLRTQLFDLNREARYSLELTLRSGEVLHLPSKRLLTSAQRLQAELEGLAGIG